MLQFVHDAPGKSSVSIVVPSPNRRALLRQIGVFSVVGDWIPSSTHVAILTRASGAMGRKGFTHSAFLPLVTQEMGVSLRALDWFVTNYSKKVQLRLRSVNVHASYKKMLAQYRRKNFDPFRRYHSASDEGKVAFTHEGVAYETTVGQVNFIVWAHEHGVLDYAREHINDIEADMDLSRREGKNGEIRRRALIPELFSAQCSVRAEKLPFLGAHSQH